MCVVADRTSRTPSNRTTKFIGVMAVVGGALLACGNEDREPGGAVGAPDALGAGNGADVANGTQGGSGGGDAGSSGADARAGDGSTAVDGAVGDGAQTADGAAADGAAADGAEAGDAAFDAGVDANGETLVIRVNPRNDCTVTTIPPSPIKIPAGQWFHATFINVGEISTDIDKRDPFNLVPLVLGLEPGNTYADTIRPWCQGFSGKFWFEINPCENTPYDLEVDCGP